MNAPSEFGEWSRHARLANASFGEDPADDELGPFIKKLAVENVSVIEADTHLSDWLTDSEFDYAMLVAAQFNRLVHREGLKVVWYYPALEVVSPTGEAGPSMYKTHPDWVQMSIDGDPNVFYGGVVFWIDPGSESAWMSPNSPWREYYFRRVRKVAASGADGLWPDVPLYFDVVHHWCDTSHWAQAAFKGETGLDLPKYENWNDPVWRRWIAWRHENLNQFLVDMAAAGRDVNSYFEIFVETVTCDFYDATSMGLDGAYLRLDPGVTHVWEVDTVSDSDSMRYAQEDDWICLISMYKYCRAASGRKPAWTFTKGWEADDGAAVMAEALVAGCNPFEVQVPGKTVGVDSAMRTRLYGFVREHTPRIFDTTSLAQVALYHSSACRDYIDPAFGSGKFATTAQPPGVLEWWSDKAHESCYEKQWLGEFRGMLKALVHAHIPFNVLTSPTFRPADLEGYKVLLLPNLEAVSDGEADLLRDFVGAGGAVLLTGPNPTGRNEYGDERREYALSDLLGFRKGTRLPGNRENQHGAGSVYYLADLPGREYLRHGRHSDYERIVGPVLAHASPFVTTDADRRVHLEATRLGGETILQFTNFIGVTGDFAVVPTSFNVQVQFPAGVQPSGVRVASPDHAAPALQPLPYSADEGRVSFSLDLQQYALVVLDWQESG